MEDGAKHAESDKDQTLYIPSTKTHKEGPTPLYAIELGRVNQAMRKSNITDVHTSTNVKTFNFPSFFAFSYAPLFFTNGIFTIC